MCAMFHVYTTDKNNNIEQDISIYNGKMYTRLSYDEDYLCTDDINTGMHRSTIIAIPEQTVLAFAPPKTLSFAHFKTIYTEMDDIVMHDYIDGRLLQLFYDSRISSWRITPVSSNDKCTMSWIDEYAFISATCGNIQTPLNDMAILEYFPKNHCYTFVIRNQPSFESSIYLLSVYKIHGPNLILRVPQHEYENWASFSNISGIICFPKQCVLGCSYADIMEKFCYTYTPNKWVLTNIQTGMQTTVSTNEYRLMKHSEMIPDISKYQYLCLQRINKHEEYVNHFQSRKREFYEIKHLYDWFVRTVHEIYIDYYIKKTTQEIPLKYKNHIEQIHNQYYVHSMNRKKTMLITKHTIKKYFDKKDPHEIKSLLNCYEYH